MSQFDLGSIRVSLIADLSAATKATSQFSAGVSAAVERMTGGLRKFAGGLDQINTIASAGLGLGLIAKFTEVDKAMLELRRSLGLTADQFAATRAQIIAFASSGKAGGNILELTEAMRGLTSVTTDAARLMTIASSAVKLAKANFAEVGGTVRAVATTMNTFRVAADDTSATIAKLNVISEKGRVGVEDLGQAVALVGPLAAASNLSLDQTLGILKVLSDETGIAAEGAEKLRIVIQQLNSVDPLSKHGRALQQVLGTTVQLSIATRGFLPTFKLISDAAGGSANSFKELIDGTSGATDQMAAFATGGRGLTASLRLQRALTGELAETMKEIGGAVGADVERSYQDQKKTLGELIVASGKFQATKLAETFEGVVPPIKRAIGAYNEFIKAHGTLGSVIPSIAIGLSGLAVGFAGLRFVASNVANAFSAFGQSVRFVGALLNGEVIGAAGRFLKTIGSLAAAIKAVIVVTITNAAALFTEARAYDAATAAALRNRAAVAGGAAATAASTVATTGAATASTAGTVAGTVAATTGRLAGGVASVVASTGPLAAFAAVAVVAATAVYGLGRAYIAYENRVSSTMRAQLAYNAEQARSIELAHEAAAQQQKDTLKEKQTVLVDLRLELLSAQERLNKALAAGASPEIASGYERLRAILERINTIQQDGSKTAEQAIRKRQTELAATVRAGNVALAEKDLASKRLIDVLSPEQLRAPGGVQQFVPGLRQQALARRGVAGPGPGPANTDVIAAGLVAQGKTTKEATEQAGKLLTEYREGAALLRDMTTNTEELAKATKNTSEFMAGVNGRFTQASREAERFTEKVGEAPPKLDEIEQKASEIRFGGAVSELEKLGKTQDDIAAATTEWTKRVEELVTAYEAARAVAAASGAPLAASAAQQASQLQGIKQALTILDRLRKASDDAQLGRARALQDADRKAARDREDDLATVAARRIEALKNEGKELDAARATAAASRDKDVRDATRAHDDRVRQINEEAEATRRAIDIRLAQAEDKKQDTGPIKAELADIEKRRKAALASADDTYHRMLGSSAELYRTELEAIERNERKRRESSEAFRKVKERESQDIEQAEKLEEARLLQIQLTEAQRIGDLRTERDLRDRINKLIDESGSKTSQVQAKDAELQRSIRERLSLLRDELQTRQRIAGRNAPTGDVLSRAESDISGTTDAVALRGNIRQRFRDAGSGGGASAIKDGLAKIFDAQYRDLRAEQAAAHKARNPEAEAKAAESLRELFEKWRIVVEEFRTAVKEIEKTGPEVKNPEVESRQRLTREDTAADEAAAKEKGVTFIGHRRAGEEPTDAKSVQAAGQPAATRADEVTGIDKQIKDLRDTQSKTRDQKAKKSIGQQIADLQKQRQEKKRQLAQSGNVSYLNPEELGGETVDDRTPVQTAGYGNGPYGNEIVGPPAPPDANGPVAGGPGASVAGPLGAVSGAADKFGAAIASLTEAVTTMSDRTVTVLKTISDKVADTVGRLNTNTAAIDAIDANTQQLVIENREG